jgi:hypothetical protein
MMRSLLFLLVHFLATLVMLLGPGGLQAVVAENLLIKRQLLVLNRSRRRAPVLWPMDRIVMGLLSLCMNPRRLLRAAVVVKPSTLLRFHRALIKRKYRLLFSSRPGKVNRLVLRRGYGWRIRNHTAIGVTCDRDNVVISSSWPHYHAARGRLSRPIWLSNATQDIPIPHKFATTSIKFASR